MANLAAKRLHRPRWQKRPNQKPKQLTINGCLTSAGEVFKLVPILSELQRVGLAKSKGSNSATQRNALAVVQFSLTYCCTGTVCTVTTAHQDCRPQLHALDKPTVIACSTPPSAATSNWRPHPPAVVGSLGWRRALEWRPETIHVEALAFPPVCRVPFASQPSPTVLMACSPD